MSEAGTALIIAILAVLLLSALGFALVLTTSTETMIAGNYARAQEGLYAADAVAERAVGELLVMPDWNQLLDGSMHSAFVDGAPGGVRTLPDGSPLDLAQVLSTANCGKPIACSASDITGNATGDRPWGANNPVWRLYAYGMVNDLLPTGTINSPFYAVVLVADDPSENDGDPTRDGADEDNPGTGVLVVRAEAFGPRGAHKVIELTLARTDSGLESGAPGQGGVSVRIRSWREVR